MKLHIIHSGSDGNCSILADNKGNQLMLDCGIDYEKIVANINFSKLDAILTTHFHKDHSLSEKEFAKYRVTIFNQDNVKDGEKITLKNWIIMPMRLIHNVKCYGFLIYSRIEKKKIAYITDTCYIPKLAEVDCLICDCNYDLDIVDIISKKGCEIQSGYKNHLSIQAVESYLKDLPYTLSCFVAFHLSNSGLINVEKLKKEISPLVKRLELSKPNTIIEV
jgi:phosphoribosyl 1,2-cyclic phosphodiesterase